MKKISRAELIEAISTGKADPDAKSLAVKIRGTGEPAPKKSPLETLSDQLKAFTETVQAMSKDHADEMTKVLRLMILAYEAMANQKPVEIDLTTARPKKWTLKITGYNKDGRIESMEVTADDETIH